jgi:hypothetical protein
VQGECRVSRGESKVSRWGGLPRISRAPRSKPKMASLIFGGLLETPVLSPWWSRRLPTSDFTVPTATCEMGTVFKSAGCTCFTCRVLPLQPPLPPHHHRHGQKEDYWSRAGRSCQSEWLLEGCKTRQRQSSRPQYACGQGQAGSRCRVRSLCPVRGLCLHL